MCRQLAITCHPTNSDRKSRNWAEHHFPLRRLRRHLIAARMQLYLEMSDIHTIISNLREGNVNAYTWGRPGSIQLFVNY